MTSTQKIIDQSMNKENSDVRTRGLRTHLLPRFRQLCAWPYLFSACTRPGSSNEC